MESSNTVNMSFRVEKKLKKQADELFKRLGLNTSVALNMFLTQCVREQGIPFTPNMGTPLRRSSKVISDEEIEETKANNIEDLL